MKIISKEGFSLLERKFKVKISKGYLNPIVCLHFYEKEDSLIKQFRDYLSDSDVRYSFNFYDVEVSQTELIKIFADKYLEDGRFWYSYDKIHNCKTMDHQQLSNCVNNLDILLTLNKISSQNAEEYLKNLNESIIPELKERFGENILEYKPSGDYEKTLFNEYLKIIKKEKKDVKE